FPCAPVRVLSSQCFCSAEGDDPFELGESTDCTFDCAGDDSQTCGGRNAMNIYEFDSEYEFLGCFADSSSARVLTGPSKKRDSTMTAAVCSAFCGDVPFFGTQFGNE
ncbi:unnamed protein product, partial [Sphacelaria rigidula]